MKEKLAEALKQAVNVIEQWHGKEVFDIYYNHAPEMKLIRDALAGWEAKEASIGRDEAGDVKQFTKIDMIHAAKYGFTYATQSQHSGEVQVGNILQWLKFYQETVLNSPLTKEGDEIK